MILHRLERIIFAPYIAIIDNQGQPASFGNFQADFLSDGGACGAGFNDIIGGCDVPFAC